MGSKLFKKKDFSIISLGLDTAGKTEAIYYLKYRTIGTIPTIGFNIETIDYKGYTFSIWDCGSQDKIRVLWKHFYNMDGVMFFVDSSNRDRIEDASDELKKLLAEEEFKKMFILIIANKQDLEGAFPPEEIIRIFALEQLKGINWHVQGASIKTGQGLREGFDWLTDSLISTIQKKNNK